MRDSRYEVGPTAARRLFSGTAGPRPQPGAFAPAWVSRGGIRF